jgi:hypothetical protein
LQELHDAFNFFSGKEEDAMRGRKIILPVMAVFLMLAAVPAAVMAAPAVSAECAYIDPGTDLVCDVYVDNGADQLRSGGVTLNYNASILSSPAATKNDAVWKFTDGTTNYPYMNPDTSISGKVVFIVGVLNTANTGAGVTGRAKVGRVTFTRSATPTSGNGEAQAAFFGISAALGKGGNYVNFVNTAGTPLDGGATFSAKVARRGDANADGSVTNQDMGVAKNLILSASYLIYADADGNDSMTNADMGAIRNIILNP